MVLKIGQSHILIYHFTNLSINQHVNIKATLNYAFILSKERINTGYQQGLNIYLQATWEIEK